MQQKSVHWLAAMLLAGGCAEQAEGAPAACTFRIDLPAHSSVSTSVTRTGDTTQERTTRFSTGASARGVGTLVVNPDGSYALRDYSGVPKSASGRWRANRSGDYAKWGGIELVDVRGDGYSERSWYVYRNERGEVVGREPPYTGYNDLRFTAVAGGDACIPGAGAAPPSSAGAAAEPARSAVAPSAQPSYADADGILPPGRRRAYVLWELRGQMMGAREADLREKFGEPQAIRDGYWYYDGIRAKDQDGSAIGRVRLKFNPLNERVEEVMPVPAATGAGAASAYAGPDGILPPGRRRSYVLYELRLAMMDLCAADLREKFGEPQDVGGGYWYYDGLQAKDQDGSAIGRVRLKFSPSNERVEEVMPVR